MLLYVATIWCQFPSFTDVSPRIVLKSFVSDVIKAGSPVVLVIMRITPPGVILLLQYIYLSYTEVPVTLTQADIDNVVNSSPGPLSA